MPPETSALHPPPVLPSWKHHFLGKVTGDVTAGCLSATFISPIVTIIDRTIVERLTSNQPILRTLSKHSISSLKNPRQFYFSKPFFIVWSLYAATYSTANTIDTLLTHQPNQDQDPMPTTPPPPTTTPPSYPPTLWTTLSFLPTSIVNISLGIFKDVKFAQIYGRPSTAAPPGSRIPRPAFPIFLFRDSITIFGSFTLAPMLAPYVPDAVATSPHAKATIAQLCMPAASEFVSTPFHLMGLDLVSRPASERVGGRLARIRKEWASVSVVRAVRIMPAFGVGCVVNRELREVIKR